MKARVVLVHGLWMHAPALLYWARRLRRAGFRAETFSYRSLMQAPEQSMQRLRDCVLAEPGTHVIGHSLGGLMAVQALQSCREYSGHIVCVGSPLAGSAVVRQHANSPLRVLAGRSARLLTRGFPAVPGGLKVSMIAGTRPSGLGRWVHRFSEDSDGSVGLSETRIPGLVSHTALPVSHSGMLISRAVVAEAIRMLDSTDAAGKSL